MKPSKTPDRIADQLWALLTLAQDDYIREAQRAVMEAFQQVAAPEIKEICQRRHDRHAGSGCSRCGMEGGR